MTEQEHKDLAAMADKWLDWSRKAFINAEKESDPMGKRLIEHGAMCYFNTGVELENYLKLKDASND